jgi:glycopeptide antibiotics resistance protein
MEFNHKIINWIGVIITFFSISFILTITLSPFDLNFKEGPISLINNFLNLGVGISSNLDALGNVLLFIPLGFGLSWHLNRTLKLVKLASLIVTILMSFTLSYIIECLQLLIPSRFPSLIDVLSNSTGAFSGFLYFLLWEYKIEVLKFVSTFVEKHLMMSFLGYMTFVFLISICFQMATSLINWDKTYPLLLGNELTGNRPWKGSISEVYIADRALSKEDITHAYYEKNPIITFKDSLIAFYQFKGKNEKGDKTGYVADFVWTGKLKDQIGNGIFLDTHRRMEKASPAVYLTENLRRTSQFTIGITLATSEMKQFGPARILSLSKDTYHRNFTLGQEGSNLVFRLRTPLTGENGTNPQLLVPNVFSNTDLHNLVITYDGSVLLLYVDGALIPHKLELSPEHIPFNYLLQSKAFNLVCYKIFYYAVLFIPLGILLLIIFKNEKMKRRFDINLLLILVVILVLSFLFEVIQAIISKTRNLRLDNLLITMVFTTLPVIFIRKKKVLQ